MKTAFPSPAARHGLDRLRRECQERVERLERDRRRGGEALSADFSEQAIECENDELLDALALAARDELRQIDHALERADAGLWGKCEACAAAIDRERLARQPQATQCAACAASASDA